MDDYRIESYYYSYQFEQKKREMLLENQDNINKNGPPRRVFYSHNAFFTQDGDLLPLFLKELTFQQSIDGFKQLNDEEVQKLKIIIDNIYKSNQNRALPLTEVEGIWPLLTLYFPNINGLQIYLYFQYLISPEQIVQRQKQVKQESGRFDQRGFFQKSEWLQKANFLRRLRVLGRSIKKSREQSKKSCMRLLQCAAIDQYQYLSAAAAFKSKLQQFSLKQMQEVKSKRLIEIKGLQIFQDHIFDMVVSEPDLMKNTLQAFTQQEYKENRKTRTLIEPIEEELEVSQNMSTVTIKLKQISNVGKSSPTKRRLPSQRYEGTPRRREVKRPPRNKMVERIFELEQGEIRQKRNFLLDNIKKTRKIREQKKKRRNKFENVQRKIQYYSDDQEEKKQTVKSTKKPKTKKEKFRVINKMHIQSDPQSRFSYSHHLLPQQMQDSFSSEQSVTPQIKRNRKYFKKLPVNDFEDDKSVSHSFNNRFSHKENFRMEIQQISQINNTKRDPYSINKLRPFLEEKESTKQRLQNLQIRKLDLNEGYEMEVHFKFSEYLNYLKQLQEKQVRRQIVKIIKQTIDRQQIFYDIDLALKIIATWIIGKQNVLPVWGEMMITQLDPLLRYTIAINFYRAISEVLNNFFVSSFNEDLRQLNKARKYFAILFEAGRNFKIIGLEDILIDKFYSCMLTPNKYHQLNINKYYLSESNKFTLKNPLKIGKNGFNFQLEQCEQKIAFTVGSLVMQNLFLCGSVDNKVLYKMKQYKFLQQLKAELNEKSMSQRAGWLYSLINSLKLFYISYQPQLSLKYFEGLVNIANVSLQKVKVEYISSTNDEQPKRQMQFVLTLLSNFIQSQLKNTNPLPIPFLSKLISSTNLRNTFGKNRDCISIMIYSSTLNLIVSHPFFRSRNNYEAAKMNFINYLKDVAHHLCDQKNLLQSKFFTSKFLYQPTFQLISNIYQLQVMAQLQKANNNDHDYKYLEIWMIIQNIWDCLNRKYDSNYNSMHNVKTHANIAQIQKQLMPKVQNSQTAIQLFLQLFILPPDQANFLHFSSSHDRFALQFILKERYFIKFFENKVLKARFGEITKCFSQIIEHWFNERRYGDRRIFQMSIELISNNLNAHDKDVQLNIIKENKSVSIQQALVSINAINIIAAAEKSKKQQIILAQSPIIKLISENVNNLPFKPNLAVHSRTDNANIAKSVIYFNSLLSKLVAYFTNIQNLNIKEIIKNYFAKNVIQTKMKEITLLIFLGSATKNNADYRDIPLEQMINQLSKFQFISEKHLSSLRDSNYAYFLYNLQTMGHRFQSISDVLNKMQQYSQEWLKNHKDSMHAMLTSIFNSMKFLQAKQREKQSITVQCIKMLTFIMQWPELLVDSIRNFKTEMQLVSNGQQNLISKIKINQSNINLLLILFYSIENKKQNPCNVKGIMDVYIEKVSIGLNKSKQDFFKDAKRLMTEVRQSLKRDIALRGVGQKLLLLFFKKFCSPQKLQSQFSQTTFFRLELYLEMMKNSLLQRRAYEVFLIQNRRYFESLIPRLMSKRKNQDKDLYSTFQSSVLTCMIGRYSDFYDIKRLLDNMLKQKKVLSSCQKKIYRDLYLKLKSNARDSGNEDITNWCCIKLNEIEELQNFEEWMDLE